MNPRSSSARDPAAGEALRRLRRLRGVTWQWREEAPEEAKRQVGMGIIAQEVEAVFPELVETIEGGLKQVEYDGLIVALVAAVTGLDARLKDVERAPELDRVEGMAGERGPLDEAGAVRAAELVAATMGGRLRPDLDPDAIARIFPQLVTLDEAGERVVGYEGLVGVLIEALKELDARLAAVERREQRD